VLTKLRAEVESVLSEQWRACRFVANPALNSENLMMAVGTRLGPYEIVSPLGTRGMGEVYKAKDKREAKAISKLPNICVVHDVRRRFGQGASQRHRASRP